MVALALLMAAPVFPQSANATGQGRAVVTVFTKHSEIAPSISPQDLAIKLNGKDASVTGWTPLRGANDGLELVVLIDGGARNLGRQFEEIKQFVQGLGPHAKVAVGYMQDGRAILEGPLSADHAQVVNELHLQAGPGSNAYFSLSDLAHHWPSGLRGVRREVVLVGDGIDPSSPGLDLDDTYVQAAITDSVRAGLVVYAFYWQGRPSSTNNSTAANGGQSLLSEVTQATGGSSYGFGMGNPVSFQPFFDDLARRLDNQYELEFTARLDKKPAVENMKLKVAGLSLEVTAPQQVFVDRAGAGAE
jgi:hypothetical protein